MYKLETGIYGFDSICLMDNLLYYALNSYIQPLVNIDGNGNYSYNTQTFDEIMQLLKNKLLFTNNADDLYNYYTNLDNRIEYERRNKILREMTSIINQGLSDDVSIMLRLKDISTPKYIQVVRIICRYQRLGLGTKYLNKVISLARRNNLMVALTPNSVLGTPLDILYDFYEGIGFKQCNIIGISEDMYTI